MRVLVYNGRTFEFREGPEQRVYQPGEVPLRPQVASERRRPSPAAVAVTPPRGAEHTGYRPGRLIELGPDQCRWTIDGDVMCGARGYPWCDRHRVAAFQPGSAARRSDVKGWWW